MSFVYGSKLADFQDNLFIKYQKKQLLTASEQYELDNNRWIDFAAISAPNNLVIRNWCLADLFANFPDHEKDIIRLIKILSFWTEGKKTIWAEGYSYWLYTKSFLKEFSIKFASDDIEFLIKQIDFGFQLTAYSKDGVFFPLPYGDLRYCPLEDQNAIFPSQQCIIGPIEKKNLCYYIKGTSIGLNAHVQKDNSTVEIIDGSPFIIKGNSKIPFCWYQGYDKKYKNKKEELLDQFNPKRVLSIGKILFSK